ncbi:MAG: NAD(P)/FAD-dependent oxidoreductase [Verrucomicrobia bacterium]|nr:NAD(P)/FAD-dependent oxidoreductase [Verrucomicrobiota bacterium]MCH8528938.1 NAD(P)/FAD-dependent oxidoreductase [Kiritimatiellia bacterium]
MKHLLVLGGGTAAVSAAHAAVERGWRVSLVHAGLPLGGCCLNVGCVPSKYLIRAAERVHHARHPLFPGLEGVSMGVNARHLFEGQREKVAELRQRNYLDSLPKLEGLELIEGFGKLEDARTVSVGSRRISGDAVLIATGSSPWTPDLPGMDSIEVLTNETLFALDALPESVVVLGGGYIALEMAQMLQRLGVEVTLIQRSAHVMSNQPAELGEALAGFFEAEGMRVVCGTALERVENTGTGVRVHLKQGDSTLTFEAEALFSGLGRKGNTEGLGLDAAGIETRGRGFIQVNERLETSVPGVYAVGDVLGGHLLVYTASYEAEQVVAQLCGDPVAPIQPEAVPWVVFTDPQVAGIGLDADAARGSGLEVEEAVLPVNRWPRFSTLGEDRGFLKLIRDVKTDCLVGARALCPEGGDLMTELGWILRKRIPMREVAGSLAPYLTLSEGVQKCAGRFGG